ncbi:MAG: DUF488 domain-containing protein, partial [Deltaproteobacteria bacterium]|nr:DUF488 domain-containing protein [Deltaproteobacteria bacterium]
MEQVVPRHGQGAGPAPATVWTVGHSTQPALQLVELLAGAGIALLVDVRTVPRSARNPQFDRMVLPATLAAAGIGYLHLAELGGLR